MNWKNKMSSITIGDTVRYMPHKSIYPLHIRFREKIGKVIGYTTEPFKNNGEILVAFIVEFEGEQNQPVAEIELERVHP